MHLRTCMDLAKQGRSCRLADAISLTEFRLCILLIHVAVFTNPVSLRKHCFAITDSHTLFR